MRHIAPAGISVVYNVNAWHDAVAWLAQEEDLGSRGGGAAQPAQAAQWWKGMGAIVGFSVSAALIMGLAIGAVAYSV